MSIEVRFSVDWFFCGILRQLSGVLGKEEAMLERNWSGVDAFASNQSVTILIAVLDPRGRILFMRDREDELYKLPTISPVRTVKSNDILEQVKRQTGIITQKLRLEDNLSLLSEGFAQVRMCMVRSFDVCPPSQPGKSMLWLYPDEIKDHKSSITQLDLDHALHRFT